MSVRVKAHDCHGAIFQIEGAEIKFLCALCHKAFAVMSAGGLSNLSPHGPEKHPNAVPLDALEVAIAYVRRAALPGAGSG